MGFANFDFNNFSYFKAFFRVISMDKFKNNSNSCPKLKVFNFGRDEAEARLAWEATLGWLRRHLGPR